MANNNSQINPNSLKNLKKPFTNENQPANRGRKKSRIKAFISDYDLTADDVARLAKTVLQYTDSELKSTAIDLEVPYILRLFCRYLIEDMKTGHAKNIDLLLNRSIGLVKQKVETSGDNTLTIRREVIKSKDTRDK
jgi:hypothetical protein